jgi:hypothetical protein
MNFKLEYSKLNTDSRKEGINMKEVITSIREKLELIENTLSSIPSEQQDDLSIKLNRIDKDLRGIILFQLAVTKDDSTLQPKR